MSAPTNTLAVPWPTVAPSRLDARWISALAVLGAIAACVLLWVTGQGLGLDPDSVVYARTARSLLHGQGLASDGKPMTAFAPGYVLLLAGVGLWSGDPVVGARWVHALLWGVNVVLVAIAVDRCTGRRMVGIGAALFLAASGPALGIHAYLWSEAGFITALLAGLILLDGYVSMATTRRLLIAIAVLGLVPLIRYAGIGIIPAPVVAAWIASRALAPRRRVLHLSIALGGMVLPTIAWLMRNRMAAGPGSTREYAIHLIPPRQVLSNVTTTIRTVLVPGLDHTVHPLANAATALAGLSLLIALVLVARRGLMRLVGRGTPIDRIEASTMLWWGAAASLFAGVVGARALFDAAIPLNIRILLPTFIVAFVPMAASVDGWSQRAGRTTRVVVAALAGAVGMANAVAEVSWGRRVRDVGQGYSAVDWRTSPGIAALRALPSDVRIVANDPWVVELLAGRPARLVPLAVDLRTALPNANFGERLATLCRDARAGTLRLVWFRHPSEWFTPSREDFERACPGIRTLRLSDAVVFGG